MSEHRKISAAGDTVIERAAGAWGARLLRPAPVPGALADPLSHRAGPHPARGQEGIVTAQAAHAPRPAPAPEPAGARRPQALQEPATAHRAPSAPQPEPRAPTAPAAPRAPDAARRQALPFSGPMHPIDRAALAHHGLIEPPMAAAAGNSALMEEFRIIRRRVLDGVRAGQRDGLGEMAQRILVTSPLPNEGKTFCAGNLALALAAEKDMEVVLVDADFARPSLPRVFGLPAGPGLLDVLADPSISLHDCIIATDVPGFFFLPAGTNTGSDSEYLSSQASAAVLDALTRGAPHRVVILDSPPALAASPAAELAGQVGQAIVVARADRTGQSALEDALTLLSPCPNLRLLLNGAHFSPSGRRFGAYYGQEEKAP